MNQPAHHFLRCCGLVPRRYRRAVDHDDRQAQPPRRLDLGVGTRAAGILGDDNIDLISLHKGRIRVRTKGATSNNRLDLRQGQRIPRRIDQPKQIEVLGVRGKFRQMHATDCQHHPLARPAERGNRPGNVRNPLPLITVFLDPSGASKSDQWNVSLSAGHNRIPAHLRGKRVRRVDHMGDPMGPKILNQPLNPAKTTHALRQGLAHRSLNTSGEGNRASDPGLRHHTREGRGFGCSAQYEEVRRHA